MRYSLLGATGGQYGHVEPSESADSRGGGNQGRAERARVRQSAYADSG